MSKKHSDDFTINDDGVLDMSYLEPPPKTLLPTLQPPIGSAWHPQKKAGPVATAFWFAVFVVAWCAFAFLLWVW